MLLLVRHAHRDLSFGREEDNGLSEKGQTQAFELCEFFNTWCDKEVPKLATSPAKRCIETLEPFSKKYRLPLEIDNNLYECRSDESWAEFTNRILYFSSCWQQSNISKTIICSHGDWIPAFVSLVVGVEVSLKKGGVIEVIVESGGKFAIKDVTSR